MLHKWISTLIFTALVCFVMLTLTPPGRIRKAEELICGLVMITALISLVSGLDMSSYSETLAGYRSKAEELAQSGEEYSENLNRMIIEEKTEAYILDKAESIGASVHSVRVEAKWSGDRCWYPATAVLQSGCTEEEKAQLGRWMESELGITRERQTWSE